MLRWLRALMVFGALFSVVPQMAHAQSQGAASDFTLRDINGKAVNLAEHRGKVVILSFWATWCGPCKEEMPHLQAMYNDLREQGLVVLSISSDDARTMSRVKPYIRSKGFTFPVLLDRDSSVTGIYNPAKTLPWTVVIDREFQVAQVHSGYNPGDEEHLRELVVKLLGGAEAGATAH